MQRGEQKGGQDCDGCQSEYIRDGLSDMKASARGVTVCAFLCALYST